MGYDNRRNGVKQENSADLPPAPMVFGNQSLAPVNVGMNNSPEMGGVCPIAFPGGLDAIANFVEQQLGEAEGHLQHLSDGNRHRGAHSAQQDWVSSQAPKPCGTNVFGNAQTGYRADLRVGADVKPVMNCHQCKSNKKTDDPVFCGHISIDAKGYSTTCTKRYCRQCLWNWYMEQAPKNNPESDPMWNIWRCPGCRKLCCCHRCRTGMKIQRGLDMCDLQEQAGTLSPARCLARCLQEAGFPSEINGDSNGSKTEDEMTEPLLT